MNTRPIPDAGAPDSRPAQAAERAKNETGARVATLTGETDASAVTVLRPNGQGFLLAGSMPVLDNQIYELWGALPSGAVTSLGTIPGPGTYAYTADPTVQKILISVENAPVPAPTSAPVVAGTPPAASISLTMVSSYPLPRATTSGPPPCRM